MKKIKFLIVLIITMFLFNIEVFAASGSLSVSSESVKLGDSFTVTANISSASIWDIYVSASGPVSDCIIEQSGSTDDNTDTDKSFSATCTATEEGTITIELSGSVTSASDGIAVDISDSASVTVVKETEQPTEENTEKKEKEDVYIQSNDNIASKIGVEGYELTQVAYDSYTLIVPNGVTSINVIAKAEHPRAKVSGTGKYDLDVGENIIEIVIVSESRLKNKYTIKVTRKAGYSLEELDSVLNDNKLDNINIIIKSDTVITVDDLEKIKKSKKTVNLNYYEDNTLKYSWIINGKKLKYTKDFLTTVSFDNKSKEDILRLTNSENGFFIYCDQLQDLPEGLKLKIYVGNIFKNKEKINVYSYDKKEDKLGLAANKIKVKDGYIQFDITDISDYLVTKTTVSGLDTKEETKPKDYKLLAIVLVIVFVVLAIIILGVIKNKKNKKKVIEKNNITPQRTVNDQAIDNLLNNYGWYNEDRNKDNKN